MFSLICALNKRLRKRSRGLWFQTSSCSLWRHCNDREFTYACGFVCFALFCPYCQFLVVSNDPFIRLLTTSNKCYYTANYNSENIDKSFITATAFLHCCTYHLSDNSGAFRNARSLQGVVIIKASQIDGKSTVCSAACPGQQQKPHQNY